MNNKRLNYQYNCVSPKDKEELNCIINNSVEITYKTFISKVDQEDLRTLKMELGYDRLGISFKNDWSIQYYKSKNSRGKTVYYLSHSRIEYVFY